MGKSYSKNTTFNAIIDVQAHGPLDQRLVVDTANDLIAAATFPGTTAYSGMPVVVKDSGKLYILKDEEKKGEISNDGWVEIATDSGAKSASTVIDLADGSKLYLGVVESEDPTDHHKIFTLSTKIVKMADASATNTGLADAWDVKQYVDAETTRAEGVESTLDGKIAAEKTRAEGAESTLDGKITAEIERATAEEGSLRTSIDRLDEWQESFLDNDYEPLKAHVAEIDEVSAAAFNDLNSRISGASEDLEGKIAAEAAAREAADSDLDGKITAEATARENADSDLQDAIDKEISDREAAETALGNSIAGEYSRAVAKETELEGKITTATADSKVEIDEIPQEEGAVLKKYVFYQGGKDKAHEIGTIDIPKDLVIKSGSTVDAFEKFQGEGGVALHTIAESIPQGEDPENWKAIKAIKLVIENQEAPVYINVQSLVDVYTGADSADGNLNISVSEGVITPSIKAGSVLKQVVDWKDSMSLTYMQTVESGAEVTILASAHGCGLYPLVQVIYGGMVVNGDIYINASGDVRVDWADSFVPSASDPIIIRIVGHPVAA